MGPSDAREPWHDTRTIQAYLGHRSIQHTVKYTELAPGRFKGLFKD
jgi:type 1 fimbriae regulatory protein FimB